MTSTPIEHCKANKHSIMALLPFVIFLGIFLGTSIVLTLQGTEFAFYQLPASIAIIPAILLLGTTLGISPIAVVSHAFYPMILFFVASFAFWQMTKD